MSENAETHTASLRCQSCGADYIAGTTLCADCLGTDLRPITAAPVRDSHLFLYFWLIAPVVVAIFGYLLLAYGTPVLLGATAVVVVVYIVRWAIRQNT